MEETGRGKKQVQLTGSSIPDREDESVKSVIWLKWLGWSQGREQLQ
jgi:hypothetical protein